MAANTWIKAKIQIFQVFHMGTGAQELGSFPTVFLGVSVTWNRLKAEQSDPKEML